MRQVTDQVGVELTDLLLCEDSALAVLPPPRHVLVLKGDETVIRCGRCPRYEGGRGGIGRVEEGQQLLNRSVDACRATGDLPADRGDHMEPALRDTGVSHA